jgi:hypothetical protein
MGSRVRFCFAAALVLALSFGARALAAPAWYSSSGTANQIDPNLPDFYQHQNLVASGSNAGLPQFGWEGTPAARAGWCFWTAYSDAFYDLTTQGYTGLLATSPTGAGWYSAIYGATPATSSSSDIAQLVGNMSNVGTYLLSTASSAALLSDTFSVNASGTVNYTDSFGSLAMAGSSSSIFAFTNSVIKNLDGEVLYKLDSGTTTPAYYTPGVGRPQGRWWGSFHYVAVAGLNLSSSTSIVADPDTNINPTTMDGSGTSASGWPLLGYASSAGFPFVTPSNAALPVIGNSASFAGFKFAGQTVSSLNSPQYNGTFVTNIAVIYPKVVVKTSASAAPAGGGIETDITLSLPVGANAVDGIFIEPSSATDSSAGSPGLFSFHDDSNPSTTFSDFAGSASTDPYGNSLPGGGALYLSTSGDFMPGQTADVDLATSTGFTASGYDVLLHFAGDPAGSWLPVTIGGTNFDPSDVGAVETDLVATPEPSTAVLFFVGLGGLGLRTLVRRRRRRAQQQGSDGTLARATE